VGDPHHAVKAAEGKDVVATTTPGGDPSVEHHDDPAGVSAAAADYVAGPYRAVMKFLNRRALARATLAVPRTLKFVGSTVLHVDVANQLPAPNLTLGLAAQVAMDEALLAMAMTPRRFPMRSDYQRVGNEIAVARKLYRRKGWLSNPASYHNNPPTLTDSEVIVTKGKSRGRAYRRLTWTSGFSPHPGEPGGERWQAWEPNKTATATILQHEGPPRPWVICVHGFCMGFPLADFKGLHAERLHDELGLNVAMPVLPLHGPRKVTFVSGEPFLSFELMNAVHGLTQAVWDIRRLIGWILGQGAPAISAYGVSLGGNVVSLLAGLEDRIDAVVAGIPVSDFPALFHHHTPRQIRARAVEHHIMGGPVEEIYTVVSPFSYTPTMPLDRRFIFAGYGDRLATPEQAQRLWEHWDKPSITWYPGNHVGYLWSTQVADFLCESLRNAGLAYPAPTNKG
jgi:hypothetical protein